MNPIDIAVIVCVSILVAGVAAYLIYRKVKHKGGCCDCDCGGHCSECGMCAHANSAKNDKQKSKPDDRACPHCGEYLLFSSVKQSPQSRKRDSSPLTQGEPNALKRYSQFYPYFSKLLFFFY